MSKCRKKNSTSDERVEVKLHIDEPGQVGKGDISQLTDDVVRSGIYTSQELVFKSVGGDCGVSGNVKEQESESLSLHKGGNVPDSLCVAKESSELRRNSSILGLAAVRHPVLTENAFKPEPGLAGDWELPQSTTVVPRQCLSQ